MNITRFFNKEYWEGRRAIAKLERIKDHIDRSSDRELRLTGKWESTLEATSIINRLQWNIHYEIGMPDVTDL